VSDSIVIQQPAQQAQQLMVLHHGEGDSARHMEPLGRRLAAHFPHAFIVSVQAPYVYDAAEPQPADADVGGQWYPSQDIDDAQRAAHVAQAVPAFVHNLRYWQTQSGVGPDATAIFGFAQGATMVLEAAQVEPALAARIIVLSSRYAQLPNSAPEKTTLHFIHGKGDTVVHYGHCVAAAERLVGLGGDLTADVIPFLEHEVTDEVMDLVLERLTGHIPKHQWEEVQKAAAQQLGS
jgi:phospholipase/carboxylesterase